MMCSCVLRAHPDWNPRGTEGSLSSNVPREYLPEAMVSSKRPRPGGETLPTQEEPVQNHSDIFKDR